MKLNPNYPKTILVAAAAIALMFTLAPLTFAQQEELQAAMADFKAGKYAESAQVFQEFVDQAPNYDYGYFMLGNCFTQMNKLGDAESNFQKAIEINGDRFEYHYGLASAYYKQRKYRDAIATLNNAEGLAAANQMFPVRKLRGLSYAALKKWPEAVADLEEAAKVRKESAIIDQLSHGYEELGYPEKALPLLRETHKARPDSTNVMVRLASSLIDMGAEARSDSQKQSYYDEALQVSESLARTDPGDFDSHNLVGRAALGAKNFSRAEQAFSKALSIDGGYCFAKANLGKVYIAQQKWSDAERVLRDAIRCDSKLSVAHESLGFAIQKQAGPLQGQAKIAKLQEAISTYENAMKIKPSNAIKGMIAVCQENIGIANDNLEIEAELAANQEAIRAAEEANRKAEEARKAYEEAQKKRDD